MKTTTCPDHKYNGTYTDWCYSDDGKLHMGRRCSMCQRWLRWEGIDRKPPKQIARFKRGSHV